uniref:CCHC-type domain-containing protein n=1 Tax=Graphocephala atropunctata TaxID=36148 RepID=A0A1B6L7I2_9HEMI
MSRYRDSGNADCKIYVGDLGSSASKQDLEDSFSYYGPIRNVWVARNPPGFAFVEFEDPRDAEDAVRGLDGRSSTVCGRRVRVEMSNGARSKGGFRGPPPRRSRPFHPEDRCYECGERGHYARDCTRYSSRRGGRRRYVHHSLLQIILCSHIFSKAKNLLCCLFYWKMFNTQKFGFKFIVILQCAFFVV